MRKLCASILFIAACGSDNKAKPDAAIVVPDAAIDAFVPMIDAPPDAQTFDFSCAGNPLGTPAATITVGGTALALNGMQLQPVANATMKLFKQNPNGDILLDTQGPTDATGAFTFAAQTTNGTPLDAYIQGHLDDQTRDAYVYPADPLVADFTQAPAPLLNKAQFAQLAGLAGFSQTDGNGAVGVAITDCVGTPIGGVALTATQNGQSVGSPFDVGTFVSQAQGTYFIFDVPPGAVTISGTIQGMNLHAHDITSFADATSGTQLHP